MFPKWFLDASPYSTGTTLSDSSSHLLLWITNMRKWWNKISLHRAAPGGEWGALCSVRSPVFSRMVLHCTNLARLKLNFPGFPSLCATGYDSHIGIHIITWKAEIKHHSSSSWGLCMAPESCTALTLWWTCWLILLAEESSQTGSSAKLTFLLILFLFLCVLGEVHL